MSPVGARGLAQFMPGTAKEIWPQLGYQVVDAHAIRPAIEAGAFYMYRLRRSWASPRPIEDRQKLAQASYNAGLGNLIKAQRLCGMAIAYPPIVECLSRVTGRHSRETITYVERIARWRAMMEAGL